jgi:hypothetical protein
MTSGIQVRDSTLKIGIPFTVWHLCESPRCTRLPGASTRTDKAKPCLSRSRLGLRLPGPSTARAWSVTHITCVTRGYGVTAHKSRDVRYPLPMAQLAFQWR